MSEEDEPLRIWPRFDPDKEFVLTCATCGRKGLRWFKTDRGWRMYDREERMHIHE